eukprot:jgi/Botrbrau1/21921/Bobra.0249s0045.1
MAIFGLFGGSKPSDEPSASTSAVPKSASEELLHTDDHSFPGSNHSEVLRDHSATLMPGFPSTSNGGERLYNPYEGLNTALDTRATKGGFKLPSQPEFLFSEEATVHRRSWSENLTYYTGTGYLSGAVLGGGQGAIGAVRTAPEIGPNTARLRLNRLLNMSGRTGRSAGNALGVLGLFFSSFESGIGYLADGRTSDAVNSVAAGFCTGALYRTPRGPRAAVVAGTVGAAAASLLVAARNTLSKNL